MKYLVLTRARGSRGNFSWLTFLGESVESLLEELTPKWEVNAILPRDEFFLELTRDWTHSPEEEKGE